MDYEKECSDLAFKVLNPGSGEILHSELTNWLQLQINCWLYDDQRASIEAAKLLLSDPPREIK